MGLERFVSVQESTYAQALSELHDGRKRTHWMWFVFPQIAGLGQSDMARRFAIADSGEARDYLCHPVLGPRLLECCDALLKWKGLRGASDILGPVDAMKLRSSMTLFEAASGGAPPFLAILDAFYGGERDPLTLELLT